MAFTYPVHALNRNREVIEMPLDRDCSSPLLVSFFWLTFLIYFFLDTHLSLITASGISHIDRNNFNVYLPKMDRIVIEGHDVCAATSNLFDLYC